MTTNEHYLLHDEKALNAILAFRAGEEKNMELGKLKKVITLLLVVAMIFAMAACGSSSSSSSSSDSSSEATTDDSTASDEIEPLTITMYNPVAGNTVDGTLIPKTIELIEEYSGGAITVELIAAGTLGAEKETAQLLVMGDVDMVPLSIDGVDFACTDTEMNWTSLPYLFDSFDEVDSEYNYGWMFERHQEVAATYGVDLLANIGNGFKCLIGCGTVPTSITDLAGKIVRCPDIEIFHTYYAELGLTTVSGIDQYTGLQQGTMDCITNSYWAMDVFSLQEVADWLYVTNESWGTMYWAANLEWTSSLSDAQREVIYKAALEAAEYTRAEMRETINGYEAVCEAAGMTVVYPSDEDMSIIKEAAYNTWVALRDNFDSVAMDKLFESYLPEF